MQDQLTQAMAFTAMAQSGPLPLLPALGMEPGEPAPSRQIVRRTVRTVKALCKLTMRRAPKWAVGVVAVALVIPGPLDEMVIFPALALYVGLRNRAEFASVAREAWSR